MAISWWNYNFFHIIYLLSFLLYHYSFILLNLAACDMYRHETFRSCGSPDIHEHWMGGRKCPEEGISPLDTFLWCLWGFSVFSHCWFPPVVLCERDRGETHVNLTWSRSNFSPISHKNQYFNENNAYLPLTNSQYYTKILCKSPTHYCNVI